MVDKNLNLEQTGVRKLAFLLNLMEHYLLEKLTREIKISALNILRENAEISFLDKIAQSSLAKRLKEILSCLHSEVGREGFEQRMKNYR